MLFVCVFFVNSAYTLASHETSRLQAFAIVTSVVTKLEEVLRQEINDAPGGVWNRKSSRIYFPMTKSIYSINRRAFPKKL